MITQQKAVKIECLTRDNIGIYDYPNAIIFADKTRNEYGDYKEIGRIIKSTGEATYNEKYLINKIFVNMFANEEIAIKQKLLNQLNKMIGSKWADSHCNFYDLLQVGEYDKKYRLTICDYKKNIIKQLYLSEFLRNYEIVK